MGLGEYNKKRDFKITAEPPGNVGATPGGNSFVIQKHAARRLHYDFRLELGGVLKSWSVPKGPSFDPAAKRLAVAVEDHPIDYGGFEGVIPAGQYGGGTVLLWDRGTWSPVSDPAQGLAAGHLKFDLFGEKLRGRWALIRLKPRGRAAGGHGGSDDRSWLLVKDRDDHARSESAYDVTEARPESVATGRDLPAIAAASDRVWHSNRARPSPVALKGARAAAIPDHLRPAVPKRVRAVPGGDDWLHEIEIMGERLIARVDAGNVQLLDAHGADRTRALAPIAAAVRALPANQAILDGVATALGADGHSGADRPPDTLYLFDLPYLDEHDLRGAALVDRKELLASLVAAAGSGSGLRYADHVVGRGPETFAHATALGASGIVSKKLRARYPASVASAASSWRVTHREGAPAVPAGAGRRAPRASNPSTAAPTAKASSRDLRVAGVKLTHPDRVLYPEVGVTKLELARFYERVGELMLPYVEDRPLTLVRAPDGVTGHRFYVRHAGDWAPPELRQFEIKDGTGSGTTMLVDDVRGLVALAQMNVLEIHTWNARTADLERPDRIVFDLDPGPDVPWSDVVDGARRVRDVLETLDLASFVKTTGGKGLHVVVPLTPAAAWEDTLEFSRTMAQALARFEPRRFSAGLTKAARTDKIFVDYLRNRRGATSASVYSSRAQPTATVSVPVSWEVLGFGTRGDSFHVGDVASWLAGGARDPWAGYHKTRQKLTATTVKAARAALERAPR